MGIEPFLVASSVNLIGAQRLVRKLCAECKVRVACLEHALSIREKQGVWGGATERERRRIIRQRRRTA
jgi:WhiB family redox-sensing transcriptional regulator